MEERVEHIGESVRAEHTRLQAELDAALEELKQIRAEHGHTSSPYAKGMAKVRTLRLALGDVHAAGGPGRRRPDRAASDRDRRARERQEREDLQKQIAEAADAGDLGKLRELGLRRIAEQLAHKDPVRVRDAAKALLTEIRVDDDDEARVVIYMTPAAPGWAAFPPHTHYLPPEDAVMVDAAADG